VRDALLASAPDTVIITTQNSPPVAGAGLDQSTIVGGLVLLNGTGSRDVDDDALTFQWSFTVRPAGSAATLVGPDSPGPSFLADVPGLFVVQLIVNDGSLD